MFRSIRNVPSLLVATALVAACSKEDPKKVTCPAGQHESGGQCVVDVLKDTTAPTTTLSSAPGTYRVLTDLTLTADEPSTIYYTLDGTTPEPGVGNTISGASPVALQEQTRSFTLKYFAEDGAGNREAVKEASFVIDSTVGEAVTSLTAVGAKGAAKVEVTWTKPTNADVAGVMIVRTVHDQLDGPPLEGGKEYAVGDDLGTGKVVYVGQGESFTDTDVTGWQKYEYRAFAFDSLKNYADPAVATALPEYFVAKVHVPKDGGELTITPEPGAGGLLVAGTAVLDQGDLLLNLTATGDADRMLNNAKLVLKSDLPNIVTLEGTHGVYQGKPYFYFGPSGLAKRETSDQQTGVIMNSIDDVEFQVELVTNPTVFMSSRSGYEGFYDSATMKNEFVLDSTLEETDDHPALWHNAVTPDGRKLYISTVNRNRLIAVDLETLQVENLKINSEKELTDNSIAPGSLVVSPDGTQLYMTASFKEQDPNDSKFYWKHALVLFSIQDGLRELGRVPLGRLEVPSDGSGKNGIQRTMAIDFNTGMAWVPEAGTGNLWVVDIDPLHAIDIDGDTMNGVNPIHFEDPDTSLDPSESHFLTPTSAAISPDGKSVFVGFGYSLTQGNYTNQIAVVPAETFGPVTFLDTTFPTDVSAANMKIGPDGKLYVPRVGYSSTEADGSTPEAAPGISVFTLGETPSEKAVDVLGSYDTNNDDIWDVEFIPGTTLAWASMSDTGTIFVFDWTTGTPVDVDGDASNGHTNIPQMEDAEDAYGGAITSTPY